MIEDREEKTASSVTDEGGERREEPIFEDTNAKEGSIVVKTTASIKSRKSRSSRGSASASSLSRRSVKLSSAAKGRLVSAMKAKATSTSLSKNVRMIDDAVQEERE